jgi:hypothetical protein
MENRQMPPAGNHGYSPRPGGGRPRQRLARFKSRCHDGSKTEGDCRGRLDRARAAVALSDTLQYSYLYEKFHFQPMEPRKRGHAIIARFGMAASAYSYSVKCLPKGTS